MVFYSSENKDEFSSVVGEFMGAPALERWFTDWFTMPQDTGEGEEDDEEGEEDANKPTEGGDDEDSDDEDKKVVCEPAFCPTPFVGLPNYQTVKSKTAESRQLLKLYAELLIDMSKEKAVELDDSNPRLVMESQKADDADEDEKGAEAGSSGSNGEATTDADEKASLLSGEKSANRTPVGRWPRSWGRSAVSNGALEDGPGLEDRIPRHQLQKTKNNLENAGRMIYLVPKTPLKPGQKKMSLLDEIPTEISKAGGFGLAANVWEKRDKDPGDDLWRALAAPTWNAFGILFDKARIQCGMTQFQDPLIRDARKLDHYREEYMHKLKYLDVDNYDAGWSPVSLSIDPTTFQTQILFSFIQAQEDTLSEDEYVGLIFRSFWEPQGGKKRTGAAVEEAIKKTLIRLEAPMFFEVEEDGAPKPPPQGHKARLTKGSHPHLPPILRPPARVHADLRALQEARRAGHHAMVDELPRRAATGRSLLFRGQGPVPGAVRLQESRGSGRGERSALYYLSSLERRGSEGRERFWLR
eukprot:SAG11_NODE_31_length_23119_cov_102.800608_8_plen_525_part_00